MKSNCSILFGISFLISIINLSKSDHDYYPLTTEYHSKFIFLYKEPYASRLPRQTTNQAIKDNELTQVYENLTTEKNDPFFETKKFYKNLGRKLILVISPILLIIGGVGNPLCIIILLRKKATSPTTAYLCVLAGFDVLVLYTGLLRQYLIESSNIDIRNFSKIFCKLHVKLDFFL